MWVILWLLSLCVLWLWFCYFVGCGRFCVLLVLLLGVLFDFVFCGLFWFDFGLIIVFVFVCGLFALYLIWVCLVTRCCVL